MKQGPKFKITDGTAETWFNSTIPLEAGAKIAGWRALAGTQPKVEVTELPVDIAFGDAERHIENVPTMRDLAKDIIEQAAARFFP